MPKRTSAGGAIERGPRGGAFRRGKGGSKHYIPDMRQWAGKRLVTHLSAAIAVGDKYATAIPGSDRFRGPFYVVAVRPTTVALAHYPGGQEVLWVDKTNGRLLHQRGGAGGAHIVPWTVERHGDARTVVERAERERAERAERDERERQRSGEKK